MTEKRNFVIDFGARYIKAGFAENEEITTKLDSYIGKNYFKMYSNSKEISETIGELNPENTKLYHEKILQNGLIKNENDYCKFLDKIFQLEEIKNFANISITYPLPLNTPLSEKSKIASIFLKKYNFESISFPAQPLCSLNTYDIKTGCILEIGDTLTQTMCIFDNYDIKCIGKAEFGANDIKNYLSALIRNNGTYLYPKLEDYIIEDILENFCENLDYKKSRLLTVQENNSFLEHEVEYALPDGSDLKIADERFIAPEIIFNPDIYGLKFNGAHNLIKSSLENCDLFLKGDLLNNIYLSGGCSNLLGFPDRLKEELQNIFDSNIGISYSTLNKEEFVWKGARGFNNTPYLNSIMITKKDFEESGDNIIFKKYGYN
jgi:centractin